MACYYCFSLGDIDHVSQELARQIKDETIHTVSKFDPLGWVLHRDNHSYKGTFGYINYITVLFRKHIIDLRHTKVSNYSWYTFHGVASNELIIFKLKTMISDVSIAWSYNIDVDLLSQLCDEVRGLDLQDTALRDEFESRPTIRRLVAQVLGGE